MRRRLARLVTSSCMVAPLAISCQNKRVIEPICPMDGSGGLDSLAAGGAREIAGSGAASAGRSNAGAGGGAGSAQLVAGTAGFAGVGVQSTVIPEPWGDGNCASPLVVSGTWMLPNESTSAGSSEISALNASCLGSATTGPERIYEVVVPATVTTLLRVTVTPFAPPEIDAFDPVIYLVDGCAPTPSCVAAEDSRGGGSSETLKYTNKTGAAQQLLVIVDGYDFQPNGGKYRLNIELANP
jgi:hypothetical protein